MNIDEFIEKRRKLQKENTEFFNEIHNMINHTEAVEQKAQEQYGEGYQKGLDDAWEMMRGICLPPYEGGMEIDDIIECFGKLLLKDILRRNSASEAKAKYDAWKAKKEQEDEIRVGDVVTSPSGREYIVLHIIYNDDGINTFVVIDASYGLVLHFDDRYLTKTGKHYDLSWVKKG